MRLTLLLLIALLFQTVTLVQSANSADEIVSFDDPVQREMYYALLKEYRCLKCQNQNLSDSNASLAGDLRREIRDQILAGKGRTDIDDYLVARYGEFVLYRPRFGGKTAVLWIAPFALLVLALGAMVLFIRRSRQSQSDDARVMPVGAAQHLDRRLEKARRLLKE